MERFDISTPVGTLRVRRIGAASDHTVVLRHGILLSSNIWAAVLDQLPETNLLVIDGPGHGASGRPSADYSLDRDADAMVDVLDAVDIERATLVGHSWGGMVFARTAARHPERVAALALLNTPLRRPRRSARARYAALGALVRRVGTPPWVARRTGAALMAPESLRRRPELSEFVVDALRDADRDGLARVIRSVLVDPDDGLQWLTQSQIPTLVAAGRDDYVLDDQTELEIRRCLPRVEIVRVPGGHVSPLEAPDDTVAVLRDWVTRLALPSGAAR